MGKGKATMNKSFVDRLMLAVGGVLAVAAVLAGMALLGGPW